MNISWVEPFAYTAGNLNGKDGWTDDASTQPLQVTATGVTTKNIAGSSAGASINSGNLTGINWTRPWVVSFRLLVKATPDNTVLMNWFADTLLVTFDRRLGFVTAGKCKITVDDGGGHAYSAETTVTNDVTFTISVSFNAGNVTVSIDGVLFIGPSAFAPTAAVDSTEINSIDENQGMFMQRITVTQGTTASSSLALAMRLAQQGRITF